VAERDFSPAWPAPAGTSFLPGTAIELIRPRAIPAPPLHALFDFDGTLSLVREGWVDIMVPMMVGILLPLAGKGEDEKSIEALVRGFVAELTGKQTIYQMMRLAEEIKLRGGRPEEPLHYKNQYHELLMERIASRRKGLADGSIRPEEQLVPGSLELLAMLKERGVAIHVASGTDEAYVLEEAGLLGIDRYAPGAIHGAQADHRTFSKEMVIRRILEENRIEGSRLIAFGDGYVEIADCRSVGGLAVAVASDEEGRSGRPDAWKRDRLIGAGADIVIPDYREAGILLEYIWAGGEKR
jgi:phosphoglycolate phosphatase-like HAD superfamily hydrolase